MGNIPITSHDCILALQETKTMIRVGRVGCEPLSHADTWGPVMNPAPGRDSGLGMRVTAIWSESAARAQQFAESYGVATVVAWPEDLIGQIDAVMIHEMDAGKTLDLARPFIEARLPTYVNRPFAATVAQAEEILSLARQHRTPVTTCSALRYAPEALELGERVKGLGPIRSYVAAGSSGPFYCYAIHLIELARAVVGGGIEQVTTLGAPILDFHSHAPGQIGFLHVQHVAHDGAPPMQGVLQLINGCRNVWFEMTVYAQEGAASVSLPRDDVRSQLWLPALRAIEHMFRTGEEPVTHEELLEKHRALLAADKSARTGRAVRLDEVDDHEVALHPSYYQVHGQP